MVSLLKCGSARYERVASTVLLLTFPSSITALNPFNRSKNWSTLPIIFCAAAQLLSLGLPSSRISTTAVMSSTPAGGFFSDLASPRSFLFSVSSAASACSTSGSAAARSFSQLACFSDTSAAMTAHFSASTCAAAFSSFAFSFSMPTFSAKASASFTFTSTASDITLASSISTSTSFFVLCSFSSPVSSRSIFCCVSCRLALSRFLYSLMSSRKVLGVV
mmetsp:Transcript_41026/g.73744  ORF Transcript_41026/g.73744 Transcript_41026/m.73744 type:complete len:219 (+) Transcript_41026:2173-2829(+)